MDANVRLDHQLLAFEGEHRVYAMLELTAPDAAGTAREALHLALIVDRSGSMSGPPLEAARACARYLVRRLQPTDRLALVTYDDVAELRAPLDTVDRDRLEQVIEGIDAGGMTNLSGGWLLGADELRRAPGPGVRKALLLSDGRANQGITDRGRLATLAKEYAHAGVGTSTIGFGPGFDEDLMTAMADEAGGNAYFAETPEDAPGIFAEEFDGLVALVAQNLVVELRPSAEVELIGVLNDYPAVAAGDGLQIQMGDVYGGERRRLLFELHVPEVAKLGVRRVATLVVRYVGVGDAIEAHDLTVPITVNLVSADEAAAAEADHEVVEEVTVLAADALDQSAAMMQPDAFDALGRKAMTYSARAMNRGRMGPKRGRRGA